MRVLTQQRFGGPEVLEVAEAETPTPTFTEVLVKVAAVGINPIELAVRSGDFPMLGEPPFTLGWDISGTVERTGPGASRFKAGDEVFGLPFFPRAAAGAAEYVRSPSRMLARKPAGLTHVQAAALPLVGLTAWQGLVDYADLRAGQRVLIHGGGGGVGHIAVQVAKAMGAYVIATASAAKRDFVLGLGADEVIDYRSVDFTDAVDDVDVAFDVIGGEYAERSLQVLRPRGILISAVDHVNPEVAAKAEAAGRRFAGIAVEPDYVGLERLAELVDLGKLRVHVERTLPLEEAGKAHELVAAGHLTGKVVLTI